MKHQRTTYADPALLRARPSGPCRPETAKCVGPTHMPMSGNRIIGARLGEESRTAFARDGWNWANTAYSPSCAEPADAVMYQRGFKLPPSYQGLHDASVFAIPAVDGMDAYLGLGWGEQHEFMAHMGCVEHICVRSCIAGLCRPPLQRAHTSVRHGSHSRGSDCARYPFWLDAPG